MQKQIFRWNKAVSDPNHRRVCTVRTGTDLWIILFVGLRIASVSGPQGTRTRVFCYHFRSHKRVRMRQLKYTLTYKYTNTIIHMHRCTPAHIRLPIYTDTRIHIHVNTLVPNTHTYTHACIHSHKYTHTLIHTWTYTLHTCIYTLTLLYIHTHVYTLTYTHASHNHLKYPHITHVHNNIYLQLTYYTEKVREKDQHTHPNINTKRETCSGKETRVGGKDSRTRGRRYGRELDHGGGARGHGGAQEGCRWLARGEEE